jgi:hypothetical protein
MFRSLREACLAMLLPAEASPPTRGHGDVHPD